MPQTLAGVPSIYPEIQALARMGLLTFVGATDATNTAAQLAAKAAAGELVPYTTYVANDVTPASPQWARSATELVSPSGASLIPCSYPGLVGSLVEF